MLGMTTGRVPHSRDGFIVPRVGLQNVSAPTPSASSGQALRTMRPCVEWGTRLLGIFVLSILCASAHADSTRCGAGKDLVVRALERITPSSPTGDLQDADIL